MNETFNEPLVKRIGGSPEGALTNNYTLDANEVLQEAWELTKVTKGPFLAGIGLIFVIVLVVSMFLEPLKNGVEIVESLDELPGPYLAGMIVLQMATTVFLAGLISMGLRNAVRYVRSNENEVTLVPENKASMIFDYFGRSWPIIAVEIMKQLVLLVLLTFLGVAGFVLGVLFNVGISLAIPLVIKDQLNPFKAVRVSLTVIARKLLIFITVYFVMFILAALSILSLGVGFIWVIPMFYNVKGILYREVFGIETHVNANDEYSQI